MRSLCIRSLVLASMAFPLVACGSAPNADAFSDPGATDTSPATDGAVSDTSTGGDTTPGADSGPAKDTGLPSSDTTPPPTDTTPPPVDSGAPLSLDNVCDRLASAICTSTTKTCCTSRSVAYSETGCRDNVLSYCGTLVDEVKSGDRTFDPTKFDGCAAAWKTLTTTCSVPVLTYTKVYAVCDQLLNGSMSPGDVACSLASDCKSEGGALSGCSDTSSCQNFLVGGKDQPCNYDGPSYHLCDYGFYCSFSTPGSKCQSAKSIGSGGCFGSNDPSCGWGNRCDGSNHCAPGLPMGSSCSADLQCASWSCNTGRCTDPNVEMAIATTCGG